MYYNIYIYTNSSKLYCGKVLDLLRNKFFNFSVEKIFCRDDKSISWIKQLSLFCENYDDLTGNTYSYANLHINLHINLHDYVDVDLPDDKLLILSNRLFKINNVYNQEHRENENFNIKDLIIKYKL